MTNVKEDFELMNNPNIILQANAVSKTVLSGETPLTILDDIHLSIAERESVAILGISGAGKSTLLSCLAGLDTPTTGSITFMGANISEMNEEQRAQHRRDQVGFVFQSFQLIDTLTALENVMLPLELQGKPAEQSAQRWLDRIGLGSRQHHYPNQLSGGEQQRVAIARAFMTKPKILFADEPTGNLDTKTSQVVEDLLFELNAELATTLVIVTHNEALAQRCQRTCSLAAGKLTC